MVNLKTGKSFQDACDGIHAVDTPNSLTRRSALKGLAAILAAGVAPSLCGSITRGLGYRNLAGRMAAMGGGGSKPSPFRIVTIQQDHVNVPVEWVESEFTDLPNNCVAVRINDVANSHKSRYFLQCVSFINGVFKSSIRGYISNIATNFVRSYYGDAYAGDKFAILPINESSEFALGEIKSSHISVEFNTFMDYEFGDNPDNCWIFLSEVQNGSYKFFGTSRYNGSFISKPVFRDGLTLLSYDSSYWADCYSGLKYFIVEFSQT